MLLLRCNKINSRPAILMLNRDIRHASKPYHSRRAITIRSESVVRALRLAGP